MLHASIKSFLLGPGAGGGTGEGHPESFIYLEKVEPPMYSSECYTIEQVKLP